MMKYFPQNKDDSKESFSLYSLGLDSIIPESGWHKDSPSNISGYSSQGITVTSKDSVVDWYLFNFEKPEIYWYLYDIYNSQGSTRKELFLSFDKPTNIFAIKFNAFSSFQNIRLVLYSSFDGNQYQQISECVFNKNNSSNDYSLDYHYLLFNDSNYIKENDNYYSIDGYTIVCQFNNYESFKYYKLAFIHLEQRFEDYYEGDLIPVELILSKMCLYSYEQKDNPFLFYSLKNNLHSNFDQKETEEEFNNALMCNDNEKIQFNDQCVYLPADAYFYLRKCFLIDNLTVSFQMNLSFNNNEEGNLLSVGNKNNNFDIISLKCKNINNIQVFQAESSDSSLTVGKLIYNDLYYVIDDGEMIFLPPDKETTITLMANQKITLFRISNGDISDLLLENNECVQLFPSENNLDDFNIALFCYKEMSQQNKPIEYYFVDYKNNISENWNKYTFVFGKDSTKVYLNNNIKLQKANTENSFNSFYKYLLYIGGNFNMYLKNLAFYNKQLDIKDVSKENN